MSKKKKEEIEEKKEEPDMPEPEKPITLEYKTNILGERLYE